MGARAGQRCPARRRSGREGVGDHDDLASVGPRARVDRGRRSGPLGGDARRAPAPARQDRADRQRELHLRRGDGSPGLVADQQVRRGPARQALLRRLRVRRRRRASRPGARPRALPRRRARQRPAALGRPGEHGRLLQRPRAGRPDHGHEPRPWRPPDPRHGAQLLGPALRGPCLRRPRRTPSGSTTTRWRPRRRRSARSSSSVAPRPIRGSGISSGWHRSPRMSGRSCSSTWPTSRASSRPASIRAHSRTPTS